METESSTAQTWHRRQYNLFPEKDRGSTYERRKNMKLNIKKFMMTEMSGELEETIKAWDQALEERRKATPGIGDRSGTGHSDTGIVPVKAVRIDGKFSS